MLKILFVNTWMHPKNMHSLMNYKSIDFTIINSIAEMDTIDLRIFDFVYSPSDPIDVSKYPSVSFIFGPHFSVFPDKKLVGIQSEKSLYIMPGEWCVTDWKQNQLCKNLRMVSCPFGVDTEKFCEYIPIEARNKVFVYYKSRHPQELEAIETILKHNNISYKVFNYNTRYDENEYIEYLQCAKFGIWVGRHESQGFALEEALSCNIPLLVWNVRSMNQEYGQRYADIPATTIPYWDERCGEYFYGMDDFKEKCDKFLSNLSAYKPREFVLENLSMDVCEKKFIEVICANANGKI